MTNQVTEDAERTSIPAGAAGPVLLGLGALIPGLIGVVWLGLAGLAWRPWEFGSTAKWENSGISVVVGGAVFFFTIAVGLLLWIVVRGASTWRRRTGAGQLAVVLVPIVTALLILAGFAVLLSPGASQPTWGL
jgi:hypothetical protein